jgi:uncharacterized protein YacL
MKNVESPEKNGEKYNRKQKDAGERPSPREVALLVRIILGIVFFILGFTFSNDIYFDKYPLFNTPFLAEFLISTVTALMGYYLIPKFFVIIKHWIQKVIFDAVTNIVTDFWEQQAERMREARKEREAKKEAAKEEEEQAKEEERKAKEEELRKELQGSIVLDTSILVDGRILDIAKTGFITCGLIIPEFVIDELHKLSDSKDGLKRRKGRRGLDLIKALKKDKKVDVRITDGFEVLEEGVDKSLVEYAKKYNVRLMTLDFNLNKVASVSDVKVLNLNDLANSLRMKFLPGEELDIKLVDEGQEKNQGVGYLEDGMMIIVENAKEKVGEKVHVRVKKNLQGSAGRMIFAELTED